ncbi:MAG: HD domain-containing protein [Paludibacter sp.]|nr:HD domain-containing protein [Paludibacter sp.]
MENKNRIELIRQEVNTILLNQPDTEQRREGYVHLYGVAQNCTLLAIRRGLDIELCTIIGLLHDIYTYKHGYLKEHATLGAAEAENLLRKLEVFNLEEIEIIKNAICYHSNKKIKHDKYSELIKDADLMQNFLYNLSFNVKHKKRIKKTLKSVGIKMKFNKGNPAKERAGK